jgi:hypothetical protein
MARPPIDRAAQLRRYADIIGKGITPISAPRATYSNPNLARFAQGLVGAGFQGAAERAATREDERKRIAQGNLARILGGLEPLPTEIPEKQRGPLASLDKFLGFDARSTTDQQGLFPTGERLNRDGTINKSALIDTSLAAGVDPISTLGTSLTLQEKEEELKVTKGNRAIREQIFGPPQIVTQKTPVLEDGEEVFEASSVNINDPYNFTQREKLILAASKDLGKAMQGVLKARRDADEAKFKRRKDEAGIANSLRDDFTRDTKNRFTIMQYAQQAKDAGDNHIGDVTILFAYLKSIDPDSVVRGNEITLTNPALLNDTAVAAINAFTELVSKDGKVKSFGRRLLTSKRAELLKEIGNLSKLAQKGFDYQKELYSDRARWAGVPVEAVVYDPFKAGMIDKVTDYVTSEKPNGKKEAPKKTPRKKLDLTDVPRKIEDTDGSIWTLVPGASNEAGQPVYRNSKTNALGVTGE